MASSEGFSYVHKEGGVRSGLRTEGFITKPYHFAKGTSPTTKFDLLVLGSGYAGLVAARDASVAGMSVLLVEARDRIGGRTWSHKTAEGDVYDLGGSWIHWEMGSVWRELVRYGIDRDIVLSHNVDYPEMAYSISRYNGKTYMLDGGDEERMSLLDRILKLFINVDGANGQMVVPIPGQILDSHATDPSLVKKYDAISAGARITELRQKGLLSEKDLAFLVPQLEAGHGNRTDKISFLELLKGLSYAGGDLAHYAYLLGSYKLKDGQSRLARLIYEEALSTGNLSHVFGSPATKILEKGNVVTAFTRSGIFTAERLLCTLPVNVLPTIEVFVRVVLPQDDVDVDMQFEPALPIRKSEAIKSGIVNVNMGQKVQHEIAQPEYRNWSGYAHDDTNPTDPVVAFGTAYSARGNAVICTFGANNKLDRLPSQHPELLPKYIGAFEEKLEKEYVGAIWHEWIADPYALGSWGASAPGYFTKYQEALQERSGNIFWASSDYASGWKGNIDGAMEEGTKRAFEIVREWRSQHGTRQA